ncbi:Thioredoxin-like fold containing protein [Senna tora]|uniref:Thioredoxin-like fold containing protein n=1 Tax=Senna tora TaxID=362788 RepID=A0A834TLY8_9FABA|nr:Thioredoxin-like fold containing protein [Senna tora]
MTSPSCRCISFGAEVRSGKKDCKILLWLGLSMAEQMEYSSGKKRFSFFNRSQTMHVSTTTTTTHADSFQKPLLQTIDRAGSINKFFNEPMKSPGISFRGKVKKLCNFFEPPLGSPKGSSDHEPPVPYLGKHKPSKSMGHDTRICSSFNNPCIRLPGTEDRIVLYYTSLRGIRRTFEDCYVVRNIFRGCRVWVDERDISMDSAYRKELQSVLGEKKNVSLPQVFIKGKYMGGAEVIKYLFEVGELAKILEGFPKTKPGLLCNGCGDVRFVPCTNCSGSRKIFDEDDAMLKRCLQCNENGLIRCPDCCP